MKILTMIVVVVLLVGAVGTIFLLSDTKAKEIVLKPVWLDQKEVYGHDQVTKLADSAGRVVASARGISDDGERLFTVRAYDAATGDDLWATHLDLGQGDNMASAVATDGVRVAAAGIGAGPDDEDVIIVALFNAINGAMLWNVTFDGGADYSVACDVAIFGGMVYVAGSCRDDVGADHFLVLAYNVTNGNNVWSAQVSDGGGENCAYALAATDNGVFATGYVENVNGIKSLYVAGFDLKTGEEMWTALYDAGLGVNKATEIVASGGSIIVAGTGKAVAGNTTVAVIRAYSMATGALVWSAQETEMSAPNDLAVGGSRLLVSGVYEEQFFVQCYDISSGVLKWQKAVQNLGELNFRTAVDVKGSVVSAAFFAQNISDDADYLWEINICQYKIDNGDKLAGNITAGTGKTNMEVDILINGNNVFFTTSIEKGSPLLQLQASQSVVAVDGRNITVNGERFIFKGVNYSPGYIGYQTDLGPWGDWFSAYWRNVYMRDIPKMADMGVNVIKLYGMTAYPWDDPNKYTLDHTDFYKVLHEHNIYVIPEVYTETKDVQGYADMSWSTTLYLKQWKGLLAEGKNNPAIIGWNIGNEVNRDFNRNTSSFWNNYNDLVGKIKQMSPGKLTIASLQDDSKDGGSWPIFYNDAKMTNLDVWGINSYRGTVNNGFDVLFSEYAKLSTKPMLVTEFGPPSSTRSAPNQAVELPNNANATGVYIKSHWTGQADSIMNNIDICSGGFVFEWNDEWYKLSPIDVQNVKPGTNPTGDSFPGHWWDEEWFGLHRVSKDPNRSASDINPGMPDLIYARAAVDVLRSLWKT